MAKKPMSVGVKAALITGSATILVAIIGLVTTNSRKSSQLVSKVTNSASISYNINSGAKSVNVAGGTVGSINTGDSTVNYNYANTNKPEFYLVIYDGKNPVVVKTFASINESTADSQV